MIWRMGLSKGLVDRPRSRLVAGRTKVAPFSEMNCSTLGRGVALVGKDHLAGAQQAWLAFEEVPRHFTFVDLGVGQREGDRQSRRRGYQVQA